MSQKYENPPVIEAVCEFRFDPASPWDMAVPGLLFEKVQGTYPKREQVRAVESAVQVEEEGIHQRVTTAERVRFRTRGGEALVQVGEHFLSINHLVPYPTWEIFRPMVSEALSAYRSVGSPTGIQRVGLRYINRIVLPPGESAELEDYFEFRPEVGPTLRKKPFTSFILGLEFPYDDQRDLLRLQSASGGADERGAFVVLLDLDYYLARPGEVDFEGLGQWLEVAHERVEEAFEGSLKDTVRSLFEVEE